MRILALGLLLLASLNLGGCTFLRLLNPVYNGVELNQSITFDHDGVAVEVRRLSFRRVTGDSLGAPSVAYEVENRTGSPVTLRPAETRLIVGPDTLAPRYGALEPRTVDSGEAAEVYVTFRYAAIESDLRERPVTLVLGGVEAGGASVRLPSVGYVLAGGGRIGPDVPAGE